MMTWRTAVQKKIVQGIVNNYWFPSLRKRVQTHVDNCLICLLANAASNSREGEMQNLESPTSPFQTIHVDHFGPIKETEQGYKHIFLVMDAFTRYTWLYPITSTASRELIGHLALLFQIFGNPEGLVSDRGSAFTSEELKNF